ncbi:MAG: ester cyclase [Planctomycetes bacterium]|nr:ester cyclase [Planctomycetota bacterium]
MTQSKIDRIRRANDALLVQGDLGAVDAFFTSDYVAHAGDKAHRGTAFVRRFVKQLRTAIPDLRVVDVEVLVQAGAKITWRRTLRGTHAAALSGLPPSGKKLTWTDLIVSRFEDGRIAEDWVASDLAEKMLAKLPRA